MMFGLFNNGGTTVTVNGRTILVNGNHESISIKNNVLYVDGKPYKEGDSKKKYEVVKVIVNGDVRKVDAATVEVNGNVGGDIDGTNVTVSGDVGGDIDGTNVTVSGDVKGDIDAMNVN